MSLLTDVQTAVTTFIAKVAELVAQTASLVSVITGPSGGAGSLVNVGPRTLKTLARVLAEIAASKAFTPKGDWSAIVTYGALDAVFYGTQAYVSMIDSNLNNQPNTSPADWMQLIDIQPVIFANIAAVEDATIALSVPAILIAGYYDAGDGGGAQYKRVIAEPSHAGKVQSADNSWWEISEVNPNVKMFGAVGDNTTPDGAAIQAAIDKVYNAGGGALFVPAGGYSALPSGIEVKASVRLIGESRNASIIQAWHTDVMVCKLSGSRPSVENLSFFGKGTNSDTGAFGATQNTVQVDSTEGVVRDCLIWGGSAALYLTGSDNFIENVFAGENCYGGAAISTSGGNWFVRNKFDHQGSGGTVTSSQPFANWSAVEAVTVGDVRVTGGYAIVCSVAGTTAGGPPTLKNYGLTMADGSASWKLLAPSSYIAMQFGQSANENHVIQCDFSGYYTESLQVNMTAPFDGPQVIVIRDCVLSNQVNIFAADWVLFSGNECGGNINIQPGYLGKCTITDNLWFGTGRAITVSADVDGFFIVNNYLSSGFITVNTGTSDHYIITGNIGATVTDGGSGSNKSITGNVG